MEFFLRPFQSENVPNPGSEPQIVEFLKTYAHGIDLEIGCGAGVHAIRYTQAHPGRGLLAVERTTGKFSAFESRLKNHGSIPNLCAAHDDAVSVVAKVLPDECLHKVFLWYPNPYPKPAQANKRFHRMPFIRCLHQKMASRAKLYLATNELFYMQEAVQWFQGLGLFELAEQRKFTKADVGSEHLPRARTHFEKKYLNANQVVYDLVFIKC